MNIDEIRKIEQAATTGPWFDGKYSVNDSNGFPICCQFTSDSDKRFIAHAREDIPYLLSELDRHKKWVNDLQSGMYVNCAYCGHRYGLVDEVPASMADVLKEHIENCPEHPMSELKDANARLTAELEQKTRELARLAIESVEREKQLAKLEAEVQYWAEAEKDGRLVVLPCKVGDTVYWISRFSAGINRGVVTAIKISTFGFDLELSNKIENNLTIRREYEKVFLTRAEAEAALKAEGVSE